MAGNQNIQFTNTFFQHITFAMKNLYDAELNIKRFYQFYESF